MQTSTAIESARRTAEICNACRHCTGYCVVFEIMEMRRAFSVADVAYLANLCHNCRNCYYACQYAPPHEFEINLPKLFSEIRAETYRSYAWPRSLAKAFDRNGRLVAAAVASAVATAVALTAMLRPWDVLFRPHLGPGAFFAIVPWTVMALGAGIGLLMSITSIGIGVLRFWRDIAGARTPGASWSRALRTAAADVLTLRNLGGGGIGCNDRDEAFSRQRRYLHHAIVAGFALCSAATAVAFGYDRVFGWPAPYPLTSVPVALGAAGGAALLAGAAGQAAIKIAGDPGPVASGLVGMDYASLVLLSALAASGLALLGLRESAAMGILLAVHLGVVTSFFLVLPYSKLVHGAYRAAALLRAALERQARM